MPWSVTLDKVPNTTEPQLPCPVTQDLLHTHATDPG